MKTVKDIDNWFSDECKQALNEIPKGIRDMANKSKEYTAIIAEYISRKKGFRKNAVLNYLDSLT